MVGKLQPPEGFTGKVRWNFAIVHAQPDEKEEREDSPYMTATVDHDGKFHIDDAPAGQYLLSVRFDRDSAGRLDNHRFAVPPTNEGVRGAAGRSGNADSYRSLDAGRTNASELHARAQGKDLVRRDGSLEGRYSSVLSLNPHIECEVSAWLSIPTVNRMDVRIALQGFARSS